MNEDSTSYYEVSYRTRVGTSLRTEHTMAQRFPTIEAAEEIAASLAKTFRCGASITTVTTTRTTRVHVEPEDV